MQYSEIISFPRTYDKHTYPVKALLNVEAKDFREIERLINDMTQARVIGHDLDDDERIDIHVACSSEDVKRRLESQWT